ncbi:pyridoxamine 5'-phosphate oxidase family protein [Rhizobium yanglingense]
MALATVGPEGLDCSPRGDIGGVVRVIDEKTLHLPDWRGNNRVDSLSNIVRDPRLALMFPSAGFEHDDAHQRPRGGVERRGAARNFRDGW